MAWIVKVGVSAYLTRSEMENNATEFYGYFNSKGFTIESVAGMLGNLQQESNINPGMKQTASASSGWGLIQWTPSSNLTNYATAHVPPVHGNPYLFCTWKRRFSCKPERYFLHCYR